MAGSASDSPPVADTRSSDEWSGSQAFLSSLDVFSGLRTLKKISFLSHSRLPPNPARTPETAYPKASRPSFRTPLGRSTRSRAVSENAPASMWTSCESGANVTALRRLQCANAPLPIAETASGMKTSAMSVFSQQFAGISASPAGNATFWRSSQFASAPSPT